MARPGPFAAHRQLRKSVSPVRRRTPLTPCPIRSAGPTTSPHRIHDELQSDARFATQPPEHLRARHRSLHPAQWTKPLQLEAGARHPIVAHYVRVDDIYPASPKPSLAAGKTPHASAHLIQTPQPAPRPRPNYAASAPLPLRSSFRIDQVTWILRAPIISKGANLAICNSGALPFARNFRMDQAGVAAAPVFSNA